MQGELSPLKNKSPLLLKSEHNFRQFKTQVIFWHPLFITPRSLIFCSACWSWPCRRNPRHSSFHFAFFHELLFDSLGFGFVKKVSSIFFFYFIWSRLKRENIIPFVSRFKNLPSLHLFFRTNLYEKRFEKHPLRSSAQTFPFHFHFIPLFIIN